MTTALWRSVPSTRHVFILSGLVFILWSLATSSLVPKSSTLSALLRMDPDRSTTETTKTMGHHPVQSQMTMQNSLPTSRLELGGLGIPNPHVYVVSLANRQDRRAQMELLRVALQNLTWSVVDAVPGNAPLVNRIIDGVAFQRAENNTPDFRWPEDINALAVSREPLKRSGSETWTETSPPGSKPKSGSSTYVTLTCAVRDDAIPTFAKGVPEWMVLSPAKVACWHSHVSAIRRFIESQDSRRVDDVAVILEDDIDIERDISARLSQVWTFLPAGWDIVFLGHCWSDESYYPALTAFTNTNLHPSRYPKCTHAYALSLSGARRLLQHLRHPPFAYSRALDQAYAWLVRSGRLRSYSIVPSLIVQRKSAASDILPGSGSEWKEGLRDGVFQA